MWQQHNKKPEQYLYKDKGTPATLNVDIKIGVNNKCPVPRCTGGSRDNFGMYCHFCRKHPEAKIMIKADGEVSQCKLCGMFLKDVEKHQKTKECTIGRERRECEHLQDKQAMADGVVFNVYRKELERVHEFKYLGRILQEDDDDTACIKNNIKKARKQWNAIAKILKREGANAPTIDKFYLTVVQAVLPYGSESWIITKNNWRKLKSFHNRALRYMAGCHTRKEEEGWEYQSHDALELKCKLFPVEIYIKK